MFVRTMTLRRRLGMVGLTALITITPTLVARAETTPAAPDTGQDTAQAAPIPPVDIALNVATELQKLGGTGTRLDTSAPGAVKCVYGANPEPLTYSTREIVIRDDLTTDQAETAVVDAITFTNSGGKVTGSELISLPSVPGPAGRVADDLTPLIVVHVEPLGGELKVVRVARRLRETGTPASPNYLMAPQKDGPVGVLPNGYPENTDIITDLRTETYGQDTNAFVMDIGIPPPSYANRPDNVEQLEQGADKEIVDITPPKGKVDRYFAGHTAAISSVLKTLVPAADVQAVRVTGGRRLITDVSATTRMAEAIGNATGAMVPEVIVASFGSAACDVSANPIDGEMVPLGLEAIAEIIARRGDSVLVAAAGNNSTNRRFYPGAFDYSAVVGVGALDAISVNDPGANPEDGMWISDTRSGPPADFSNYGPWVDAWAPGHGLPVNHLKGVYFLDDELPGDEELMSGQATVDGTSYSTPYVGGLILEQLSERGGTPLGAWQAIRNAGAQCTRELGGRAVALPTMAADANTPATGKSECFIAP